MRKRVNVNQNCMKQTKTKESTNDSYARFQGDLGRDRIDEMSGKPKPLAKYPANSYGRV